VNIIDRLANELLRMPVQTLLASLNLHCSTIQRKIQRKDRLSPAESDRVARVLYLRQLAVEVFKTRRSRSNGCVGRTQSLQV